MNPADVALLAAILNRKPAAPPSRVSRQAAPPASPPSPPAGRRLLSHWATADQFELMLPPRGLVFVPPHLLLAADPAWRRAEVP